LPNSIGVIRDSRGLSGGPMIVEISIWLSVYNEVISLYIKVSDFFFKFQIKVTEATLLV